jgi:hypothetical protein
VSARYSTSAKSFGLSQIAFGLHTDFAVNHGGAGLQMPSCNTKRSEARCPVMASASEEASLLIVKVELEAVAVVLDLVQPRGINRSFIDESWLARFDE